MIAILNQQKRKSFQNIPTTNLAANQAEEIEYFSAYYVPISEKNNLQQLINTYSSVRLGKGNYNIPDVTITLNNGNKLFGHPSTTRVSNLIINGSNISIFNIQPMGLGGEILINSSNIVSNCTIKSIIYGTVRGTNVRFENNTLIDYQGVVNIDCSVSGFMRNNKIIKHQAQVSESMLVMKGNNITPSYGNTHLHSNFLTPHGDSTELDTLESSTFVGIDGEGWNLNGLSERALLYARNMGKMTISSTGGGNSYSAIRTPMADIDADNLHCFVHYNNTPKSKVSAKTNILAINTGGDDGGEFVREAGVPTGFSLYGNLQDNNLITYNDQIITEPIVDDALTTSLLSTQRNPWAMPINFELPNPLGNAWSTERIGKPDSTAYIQNLININQIAELPEGIFYIASTIFLPVDSNHGIVGKGTGKTVICGLNDNFPLITTLGGENSNFTLSNLTLQGGNVGLYISEDYGFCFLTYTKIKFVIFRNQINGIQIKETRGFDNNFLESVSFIDCTKAVFQDSLMTSSNIDFSSYIDKTMWYNCRFINCETGIYMIGTRANNMNAWVDCIFDGGLIALELGGQNGPIIANCEFKNFTGTNVIISTSISLFSSLIHLNSITEHTIKSVYSNLEGCTLLDSSNVFAPMEFNPNFHYIMNSTIQGNVLVPRPSNNFGQSYAIYANSFLATNPERSKLLVNVQQNVPTIILDSTPNPYPQFLVTQ
jgi:hypothetical protein